MGKPLKLETTEHLTFYSYYFPSLFLMLFQDEILTDSLFLPQYSLFTFQYTLFIQWMHTEYFAVWVTYDWGKNTEQEI